MEAKWVHANICLVVDISLSIAVQLPADQTGKITEQSNYRVYILITSEMREEVQGPARGLLTRE
jgi:hypothetical protein